GIAMDSLMHHAEVALGWLANETGDSAGARTLIRHALPAVLQSRPLDTATGICVAGISAIAGGEDGGGGPLLGPAAARGGRPQMLPPDIGRAYKASVSKARDRLGRAAFDTDWTKGRAMSLEQAVALTMHWESAS